MASSPRMLPATRWPDNNTARRRVSSSAWRAPCHNSQPSGWPGLPKGWHCTGACQDSSPDNAVGTGKPVQSPRLARHCQTVPGFPQTAAPSGACKRNKKSSAASAASSGVNRKSAVLFIQSLLTHSSSLARGGYYSRVVLLLGALGGRLIALPAVAQPTTPPNHLRYDPPTRKRAVLPFLPVPWEAEWLVSTHPARAGRQPFLPQPRYCQ